MAADGPAKGTAIEASRSSTPHGHQNKPSPAPRERGDRSRQRPVGEGLRSRSPSPVRGLPPAATLSRGAGEGFYQASASSSSMKRAMTLRPFDQKAGSAASRPKGARSSLWRSVPPARSRL